MTDGARPSFVLPDLDGTQVALAREQGHPVLVHFFATWCEPCRDELASLRALVARGGGRIAVVGISVAEVPLRVRRFIDQAPVNFPVLLDEDRAVSRAWEVSTLPTTFVLDATLKPRLVAERDIAWDTIDLDRLVPRNATDARGE